MKKLQTVFERIQDKKKKQKDLSDQYRDALASHPNYQKIKDQLEKLRAQKKEIEYRIQAEMGRDYDRLESLKEDIKAEKEMLTDIAINQLMDGEPVYITDANDVEYEPVFAVRFKKM